MAPTSKSDQYNSTLEYLYLHLPMFEKIGPAAFKKDLNNIRKLCEALGNPQDRYKSIHIAGTNGKGSVSHMLSAILIEAGYKTGLYISPHYKEYTERIRVNGKFISKNFIVAFVEKLKPLIEEIRPSFFEITVAMAFEYFVYKKIDIAVIETGLGGRLDSTNIVTPVLSIITNISMDHQNMLGNTLSEIAGEKAGIMKSGVPCLIGEYQAIPALTFRERAKELSVALKYANRLSTVFRNKIGNRYTVSSYRTIEKPWVLATRPMGLYQEKNIATVVEASKWLADLGVPILQNHIKAGIAQLDRHAPLIGRWQIQSLKPMVLLDAAHNVAGIALLFKEIKKLNYKTLHVIFGTVRDKEVTPVLKLLPKEASYYFVQASLPRAMAVDDLSEKALHLGLQGLICGSPKAGLKLAKKNAGVRDIVLVTGSIFVVAEVL